VYGPRVTGWLLRCFVLACALACAGCGDDGAGVGDAGLDAIRRLAITVEGPSSLAGTRSVTVTITVTNNTRMMSFPVAGLPSTVDLEAPIQLSDWTLRVDGFDMVGTLIGRGMVTVPSGTAQTTVTLAPI
jgi:hypothetical protein